MSQPICPSTKVFKQEPDVTRYTLPRKSERNAPNNPVHAIDEADYLTIARGCDTCIIVAHREAIHDMAELCGYHSRIAHPYCCIGSFDATYYNESSHIQYQLSSL